MLSWYTVALQWRHNGRDDVSNHQPHECSLNRLFRCRSKEASQLRVTGLCVGNLPVTGEFPAQRASNAENASIWWRQQGWFAYNQAWRKHYCVLYVNVVLKWSLPIYGMITALHGGSVPWCIHYSDVIMCAMFLKTPASRLFTQAHIKVNMKALRHWALWAEFHMQMANKNENAPICWQSCSRRCYLANCVV